MSSSFIKNKLGFETRSFSLTYNNSHFQFVLPADPDAVIGEITDDTSDRFQPYWAENWPSAMSFFSFIMERNFPCGIRIGELGCGLGVLSSCLSSKQVFAIGIDISWESCRFASYNITQNIGISRIACADWRNPPFKNVFDLIIASDVLYEERWSSVILDCIKLLLVPGGVAWIADPCRRYWEGFKHQAVQYGFTLKIIYSQTIADSGVTVEILELQRSTDLPGS